MENSLILERFNRSEKLLTNQKKVLNFNEAFDYTGICRIYLYKLTLLKIPHSKPNAKMFFLRSENLLNGYFRTNVNRKMRLS